MQVDLTQLNGTGGHVTENGSTGAQNGVPKRKLCEEDEDLPEKKLKLETKNLTNGNHVMMEVATRDTAEPKEEKISIEEIRRLKEILRQEDAKLQLIKK